MNTIKIKLSANGRAEIVDKNFPLYQGQYQNVLLNIYVPTEITAARYSLDRFIGYLYADLPVTSIVEDEQALYAKLAEFTRQKTLNAPVAGDVVYYTYQGELVNTLYTAVKKAVGNSWELTKVQYFPAPEIGGTAVKLGLIATESNGAKYQSKPYYCNFVKTFVGTDGISYSLYERKMPKEFTGFIGSGQNASKVVINILNINKESNVESLVTSQVIALDILPSANLDESEIFKPSSLDEIWSNIDSISKTLNEKQDKVDETLVIPSDVSEGQRAVVAAINDLAENKQNKTDGDLDSYFESVDKNLVGSLNLLASQKQDKTDANLDTTNKTVVGAINEVKQTADAANTRSIANAGDIATLQAIIGSGEEFIGTLTINYDPTLPENATRLASDLNAFVVEETGRAAKGSDSVIVVEEIAGQTDKNFKYIYTGTEWHGYEIPPMELAANGTAGIVSGTYDATAILEMEKPTLVNIVGGEIQGIYILIGENYVDIRDAIINNRESIAGLLDGTLTAKNAEFAQKDELGRNISTYITNFLGEIADIKDGTAVVKKAERAENDENGNNIVSTYLTKQAGASKNYVKDYALPKQFNDVLYVSSQGFVEEIPTTPAGGVQFYTRSDNIGETNLATIEYTLDDVKFQLARKNSYTARYYIEADTDTGETLQFKLSTYAVIDGVAVLLHSELTTPKLIPAVITNFDFGEAFAELNNNVLELETGDKIRQVLSVVRENSTEVFFSVYSDQTYPSSFYLNTTLEVGVKLVRRASEAYTLDQNGWEAASGIDPYTAKAELQLSYTLDEDSYVELIVDPIVAAKYGFVIGEVDGNTVTFYAIKIPTEDIDLRLIIDNLGTLNDLEPNYAFGYTFYLRSADAGQEQNVLEVE